MSRITGSDAFGLMEAYNAVYDPQELTEEQVWEEVEAWVNSLVEEGHDLSEYTWEEMYEEYLNEMGQPGGNRPVGNRPISNAPYQSRFARPMNAGTPVSQGARRGAAPSRVTRPQIGSLPANYRGQELQQAAAARASQVGTTRQGTAGGSTVGGNTPIGSTPARPATPAAQAPVRTDAPGSSKPVATTTTTTTPTTTTSASTTTSTRPSAPAPSPSTQTTTSPTPAAPTPTTTPTPTATPPAPKPEGERALSKLPGGNYSAAATSMMSQRTKNILGTTKTPAAKPMGSARERMLNQSFDPFDVVMGHLIDEGYADNEDAAIVIMSNMSDEWRNQIIEERKSYSAP